MGREGGWGGRVGKEVGEGRGGEGRGGEGRGGQGRAGQGRAGQSRAGQGREGRGGEGRDDGYTYCNNMIIIMAGMAVVLRGWLPHRGEAQMAYNYCFPTRTMF